MTRRTRGLARLRAHAQQGRPTRMQQGRAGRPARGPAPSRARRRRPGPCPPAGSRPCSCRRWAYGAWGRGRGQSPMQGVHRQGSRCAPRSCTRRQAPRRALRSRRAARAAAWPQAQARRRTPWPAEAPSRHARPPGPIGRAVGVPRWCLLCAACSRSLHAPRACACAWNHLHQTGAALAPACMHRTLTLGSCQRVSHALRDAGRN